MSEKAGKKVKIATNRNKRLRGFLMETLEKEGSQSIKDAAALLQRERQLAKNILIKMAPEKVDGFGIIDAILVGNNPLLYAGKKALFMESTRAVSAKLIGKIESMFGKKQSVKVLPRVDKFIEWIKENRAKLIETNNAVNFPSAEFNKFIKDVEKASGKQLPPAKKGALKREMNTIIRDSGRKLQKDMETSGKAGMTEGQIKKAAKTLGDEAKKN